MTDGKISSQLPTIVQLTELVGSGPLGGARRHQRRAVGDHPMTEQARYIARRRIMEELKASRVKLQEIEPKDIGRAVQQYLDACKADLVSEAQARLCKSSD